METKAYKTWQFWVTAVLTVCGLATASGAVVDGSKAAEVIGWLVTMFAALGLRGWGAPAPKELPPAE